MSSWKEFESVRREHARAFERRHPFLKALRVVEVLLLFVPVLSVVLLVDYGEGLGIPAGWARYRTALLVIVVTAASLLAMIGVRAWYRWKEERYISDAFAVMGLAAIPVAWLFVATCLLDIVTDAPACRISDVADSVFYSIAWAIAWTFAGPIVDFFRFRPRG